MDALPHEAQLALISFLIALGVGTPVTLIGAGNTVAVARWIGTFMLRRRLTTGLAASLLGGAGLFGSGLLSADGNIVASLIGSMFA